MICLNENLKKVDFLIKGKGVFSMEKNMTIYRQDWRTSGMQERFFNLWKLVVPILRSNKGGTFPIKGRG